MIKTIIAAVSRNGVIGNDNNIPWHYPADWKHFRDTTRGYPIIAGRKTYESFQIKPLRGRLNIILSRDITFQAHRDVVICPNLNSAFERAEEEAKGKVFILGGAEIYQQTMQYCDEMVITSIPQEVVGDAHFPYWNPTDWHETFSRREGKLVFTTYVRKTYQKMENKKI